MLFTLFAQMIHQTFDCVLDMPQALLPIAYLAPIRIFMAEPFCKKS